MGVRSYHCRGERGGRGGWGGVLSLQGEGWGGVLAVQ